MSNPKRIRNILLVLNILTLILLFPNQINYFRPGLVPHKFIHFTFLTSSFILFTIHIYIANGLWVLTKKRWLAINFIILGLLLFQNSLLTLLGHTVHIVAIVGIINVIFRVYVFIQIYRVKNEAIREELLILGWAMITMLVFGITIAMLYSFGVFQFDYNRYIALLSLLYPITLFIVAIKINQERAKVSHVLTAINNYPNM